MKRKRKFALAVFLIIFAVNTWAFNNYCIKVTEKTLLNSKISEPVRLVLVSDLHGDEFGKNNKILINIIKNQQPDAVLVLGDMYSRYGKYRMDTAVDFMASLTAFAPVYFVSGDHDYDEKYFESLESQNVNVLNFEKSNAEINGNSFTFYGIRSEWFSSTFDLNNAFEPADESRINILLAHCPLMEKYESFKNLDFVFSGDTHGGMVRIPLLGPAYYGGSIMPKFTYNGKMYDKGYYNINGTQLFVTSGVGNYPLPVRFNNRPEIVSVDLLPYS
ncbi:MAG: metallophosphoesterase [Clostridia bacterium]|nr:metallophosphoesterase [Clostridia bacterium]